MERRLCLNWGRVLFRIMSNNLLVRVNGSDGTLPALLLSALTTRCHRVLG